jgi:hypothetical protein
MKIQVSEQPDPEAVKALLEVDETATVYMNRKDSGKEMKVEEDEYKEKLRDQVVKIGNRDSKGNQSVTTDNFVITNQKRVKKTLNEEKAIVLLKTKGILKTVMKTKTVTEFDEDEFLHLVETGHVSVKELDMVMDSKDSYALMCKETKEYED